MSKVIFRQKSSFQRDDCLFCSRESTLEAVCGNALIRCCDSEECKQLAVARAKESKKSIKRMILNLKKRERIK